MAHLAIFKKFDTLKNIGDSFTMSLTPYKDFNSGRGTITSACTDYRRNVNTDFHVCAKKEGNKIKVTRVKEGMNGNHKVEENKDSPISTVQKFNYRFDWSPEKGITKSSFVEIQFPHNSDHFIAGLKTRLNESMKPFHDFVKL